MPTPVQPTRKRRLPAPAVLAVVVLFLAGCSGSSDADAPSNPAEPTTPTTPSEGTSAANSRGSVSMEAGGRIFSFTLETCLISDEDFLIAGPGMEAGAGEPAWLEGDLFADEAGDWVGEVRAQVGTTDRFVTTDDEVVVTNFGDPLGHEQVGDRHDFTGQARNADGVASGDGKVSVTCLEAR
ncbi:hypothetical protein [Nocardioides sp. AE5]|uniref:hypothetical protein n=1 Tax=Nocardioides sp. AE5 TaxID=2962573 RepID=UPI002881ED95|nr:hypothetical protein [Nocardioides sp. AE5]MDT0200381.1 hypothetical protein [Nocardioides sp. AE5]